MRDAYDRSSKWLIEHHGDSLVRLAGGPEIKSWRAVHADLTYPRQLPDGLLEVTLAGQAEPVLFLVEIGTYPERRLLDQVVRGLTLVFLDCHTLPEVVTVILQPKGQYRVISPHSVSSKLDWTRLQFSWRVVELWNLSAADLLAGNDVGLIPWVPLTQFDEPPETIFRACRQQIDEQALEKERANLLAVIQVLSKLRYDKAGLLSILGGKQAMIESPLIQELLAEQAQKHILIILARRFGPVPEDIKAPVEGIEDVILLEKLLEWAVGCSSFEDFRGRLGA